MVKRKIIWSQKARIKLFEILEYYANRNKSTAYSKKLYKKFNKGLALLIEQPDVGVRTDYEMVRGLLVDKYYLFYEVTSDFIIVHTVWDCRQNRDNLEVK